MPNLLKANIKNTTASSRWSQKFTHKEQKEGH